MASTKRFTLTHKFQIRRKRRSNGGRRRERLVARFKKKKKKRERFCIRTTISSPHLGKFQLNIRVARSIIPRPLFELAAPPFSAYGTFVRISNLTSANFARANLSRVSTWLINYVDRHRCIREIRISSYVTSFRRIRDSFSLRRNRPVSRWTGWPPV